MGGRRLLGRLAERGQAGQSTQTCSMPSKTYVPWHLDTSFGWHHLSDATCLIRPRLIYAVMVLIRLNLDCNMFLQTSFVMVLTRWNCGCIMLRTGLLQTRAKLEAAL